MIHYYFISSPLHLCIAANIAIDNSEIQNVALIIGKNAAASEAYSTAIQRHREIFNDVVVLPAVKGFREILVRKRKFQQLKEIFSKGESCRIFTGNDRRSEFQYSMYIASQYHPQVEGVYMDDGAISYVGHKSINRIQHRYIDPVLKKLLRGKWWKNSLTVGASDWVSSAYVAFPDAVHPLLKKKKLIKLDASIFISERFMAFAADFLGNNSRLRHLLSQSKVIVTLPHEAAFLAGESDYRRLAEILLDFYHCKQIAIKSHPRVENIDVVKTIFPGASLIDRYVGMEFLLPFLSDDCIVIGDVSTTLLTAKWLRPDLTVISIDYSQIPNKQMTHLYESLSIEKIRIDQLPERLIKSNILVQ